jgi:hypothetical protein
MTAEIALAILHLPRPYANRSHMHTGPLVIATATPSFSVAESATRLMYHSLRVYDSRDSSRQPAPSPSLCYSFTHAHRSIGYRNRNPQLLAESAARLMYLRVYDSRDGSRQSTPSEAPRPYDTRSHMHTTPSPRPRSSRSHAFRYFGFLSV